MTEYLTEQEQIQQLKTWLKQYGPTVILGILVALVITFGWRYWQERQTRLLQHASVAFDEMLSQRAENKNSVAVSDAKSIVKTYPKTPYADMAAFMIARDAISKKDYSTALQSLHKVIDHSSTSPIREIARIRIARILIEENKLQEAFSILNTVDDPSFMGLINEVKGDAFLAKGDKASAKKAYQSALTQIPNAEELRPILEMKLNDL